MVNKNALHLDGIRVENVLVSAAVELLFFIAASTGYSFNLNLGLYLYKVNSIQGRNPHTLKWNKLENFDF